MSPAGKRGLSTPSFGGPSLAGHFLLAMPHMPDTRFARSVVYICSHGPEGTMGIVVNRLMGTMSFFELLNQLDIQISDNTRPVRVHQGGPVEGARGFVLHSDDFMLDGTTMVDDGIAMTSTIDILRALAEGNGPRHAFLALGYAGWQAGQLEQEISENSWLTAPASAELLFDGDLDTKWERVLGTLGIDIGMLSSTSGHA